MLRNAVFCAFALALLGALAMQAAAQSSSCSAENLLCISRGGGPRCDERMKHCKKTGCWEHLQMYGGKICNLKKS